MERKGSPTHASHSRFIFNFQPSDCHVELRAPLPNERAQDLGRLERNALLGAERLNLRRIQLALEGRPGDETTEVFGRVLVF